VQRAAGLDCIEEERAGRPAGHRAQRPGRRGFPDPPRAQLPAAPAVTYCRPRGIAHAWAFSLTSHSWRWTRRRAGLRRPIARERHEIGTDGARERPW